MVTDKLQKYVLPNIPYVFIGWVFLKLGTAYRLAAGSDFAHKFIGLGQTVGAAFADFAPGLAPFDWLVGIVGAVAFRLLIYFKSKNAKKYRRDAEYGSARWGNEKDIKPFVDPKFENNMLLTATERLTMNTRPKNPANARNLNFCGIGSSGSGKTRFWLTPQLLQAHSSYVVVRDFGLDLEQVSARGLCQTLSGLFCRAAGGKVGYQFLAHFIFPPIHSILSLSPARTTRWRYPRREPRRQYGKTSYLSSLHASA